MSAPFTTDKNKSPAGEAAVNEPCTIAMAASREWYSPDEIAALIGRAAYTVRQWCRLGRLQARKRACGRGRYLAWEIHADELRHYVNHGLRPITRPHER